MTWQPHIQILSKRVMKFSYALYKLRKISNQDTLLTAYHGYVAPILRYGIIFWGNATDKMVAFRAQKRCIRAMCYLKRHQSCKESFIKLKLLTLPCLYISELALFVKKNPTLFPKCKVGGRRENNVQYPKVSKTSLMSKSVICRAPIIYNKLPMFIRNWNDINSFRNRLNKFLVIKAYYSLDEYLNDKNIDL